MRVDVLPEAHVELIDAIVYYESAHIGLGDRFNHDFWEALDRIIEFPEAASEIEDGVRRARLTDFPFGIVYVNRGDMILIVAIMHLHRKPGYWRVRLR